MPETLVIVNTSPLLYLHQVSYLELLQNLYGTIIVPTAVVEELEVGKEQGINVPEIFDLQWIQIRSTTLTSFLPTIIDLDKGEAEVIVLGLENPLSLLIIDDRLARRIANLYHLKYTGTLGVLVKAKKAGFLASVAPIITQLRRQGMWLSNTIIDAVLNLAEEL